MPDFMKDGVFNNERYNAYREDLRTRLHDMFAGSPPSFMTKEKRIREWRVMQLNEADKIWRSFTEIDFNSSETIKCESLAGSSVKDIMNSLYILALKTNRPVHFSGNGLDFTVKPREAENGS